MGRNGVSGPSGEAIEIAGDRQFRLCHSADGGRGPRGLSTSRPNCLTGRFVTPTLRSNSGQSVQGGSGLTDRRRVCDQGV
jgi:hypothetical protein